MVETANKPFPIYLYNVCKDLQFGTSHCALRVIHGMENAHTFTHQSWMSQFHVAWASTCFLIERNGMCCCDPWCTVGERHSKNLLQPYMLNNGASEKCLNLLPPPACQRVQASTRATELETLPGMFLCNRTTQIAEVST